MMIKILINRNHYSLKNGNKIIVTILKPIKATISLLSNYFNQNLIFENDYPLYIEFYDLFYMIFEKLVYYYNN